MLRSPYHASNEEKTDQHCLLTNKTNVLCEVNWFKFMFQLMLSNETKWPSDLSLKFRFAYSSCGQNLKKESLEWFLNIIINDNII